jgi:adenosylcobinamide kinase/adenosylcobinamide-phosphate guanylyltransferase
MNVIKPEKFRLALVLGGARSGKSRYALKLAAGFSPPRLYLATAEAGDAEMAARIARHQRERGPEWQTLETPLELAAAVRQAQGRYGVLLVDCLTLWLSNWLLRGTSAREWEVLEEEFVGAVSQSATPLILVSNEVGWGIVPDNPMAREFRDRAGRLHQKLATAAQLVSLVAAGIPLLLKSPQGKES